MKMMKLCQLQSHDTMEGWTSDIFAWVDSSFAKEGCLTWVAGDTRGWWVKTVHTQLPL